MEIANPLKETFLLGALNVGLPTFDVYSDIGLAAKLYKSTVTIPPGMWVNGGYTTTPTTVDVSHSIYATSLLIPFLINYALGWRAWYFGDKNWRRKFTWIFALLGCYPQLVALRIICLFWKKPKKAMKEKKHLERNVVENEVFTEAVPSTLIMTFLMVVLLFADTEDRGGEQLLGGVDGYGWLLLVTFATSALSAGLGLAKCLKVSSFSAVSCHAVESV